MNWPLTVQLVTLAIGVPVIIYFLWKGEKIYREIERRSK
jgi:ABC-type Fe3+-siderophore transport system permease subunit